MEFGVCECNRFRFFVIEYKPCFPHQFSMFRISSFVRMDGLQVVSKGISTVMSSAYELFDQHSFDDHLLRAYPYEMQTGTVPDSNLTGRRM